MPSFRERLEKASPTITKILLILAILVSTANSIITLTPSVPKYEKPFYSGNLMEYRDMEFMAYRYKLLFELSEQKNEYEKQGNTAGVITMQQQIQSVKKSLDLMFSTCNDR